MAKPVFCIVQAALRSDTAGPLQVVTAFVMVSQQMDAELALKYVQMKHPPAWPNQGFRYQLKLFEDMGCRLVHCSPAPDTRCSRAGTSFAYEYSVG